VKTVQQRETACLGKKRTFAESHFLAGVDCKFVTFQVFTAVFIEIVVFCVVT
jgi:hypothetical protein